eukprot:COSAG02_NODE_62105_length_266_cov_43.329341_1_plen_58_part_10
MQAPGHNRPERHDSGEHRQPDIADWDVRKSAWKGAPAGWMALAADVFGAVHWGSAVWS